MCVRSLLEQADETPVDVQMREGRGHNHQAYLWQYSRPGGTVVFDFRLDRGRDGPKGFLGQFEGILQTDGYTAYDQIGGPKMVHAGCWAHSRRLFFEAVQLNPSDPVATPIVAQMDELFAIDAEARRKALGVAERHVRRQERAKPVLDEIRRRIENSAFRSVALQRAQQGLPLRARALEETYALPRVSGTGAKYEPGGEFHACDCSWSKELVAYRQPTSGTEGWGDSLGCGKLP